MSQSTSGSSSRTQSGSSLATGTLESDGTSGRAENKSVTSTIAETTYTGAGFIDAGGTDGHSSSYEMIEASIGVGVLGLLSGSAGISTNNGSSAVHHRTTSSLKGRISPIGNGTVIDPDGSYFDLSNYNTSSSQHARSLVGLQTGSGSSTFTASGSRVNNRAGTSSLTANSSLVGNSSSTLTSSSHQDQLRSASSASHSESLYNSSLTASSSLHREMAGTDAMTASNVSDREYYSQLFDALKQMWEDTQIIIRKLEAQMLLASRYLKETMSVTTPQGTLVGVPALVTDSTLVQRPGIRPTFIINPYDPWLVR